MMKFLSVALKDMRIWVRDISALGILLGMPMILILILGSAFGGLTGESGFDAKVAIVNLDSGGTGDSAQSAAHVGDEVASGLVDNEAVSDIFAVDERDDADEVRTQVERGDLVAALIIPEDFTNSINEGDSVELEVLKDPGSTLSANIWESIVRAIATDIARISIVGQTAGETAGEVIGGQAQQGSVSPEMIGPMVGEAVAVAIATAADEETQRAITIEQRSQAVQTDGDVAGIDFYAISMTSMFLVFGAMFGAFSFITERREQTLSRLLTTPTQRAVIIGGKMLAIWLLGMLQFTVLYTFTSFAFGVDWGGDPLGTFSVAAAMVVAVTGLAVLIASIAKTERGAGGFGSMIVQLMALIGGVFFPITILPEWLQPIRYASIMGWGLEGMQDIQLHGAVLADVFLPIFALIGMGVVFFAFGIWRLRVE